MLAVATTGREAVRTALENQPDVAVLDLNMPDGDGLWVCGQLRAAGSSTRALILTMYDDDENVLAALRAGAYGYTLKGSGPDELVAAVRSVARGEALFGAGIAARMLSHFSRTATASPFPQLTEREHEVLALLAAGHDNACSGTPAGRQQQDGPQPRLQHRHQAAGRRPIGSHHPSARRRPGRGDRSALRSPGHKAYCSAMRAVVLTRTGGPEVLQVLDWPEPGGRTRRGPDRRTRRRTQLCRHDVASGAVSRDTEDALRAGL